MAEIDITEIRAALRAAGIDYTREHAGTQIETIVVTDAEGINDMVFAPNDPTPTGADASDGIDCAFYNGSHEMGEVGTTDWYPTVDALIADALTWASK